MPKITRTFDLDVSPQRFLDACSPMELTEVDLLISSSHYQSKIKEFQDTFHGIVNDQLPEHKVYYCTFCNVNQVDAENGFDTCQQCLDKQ